MRTNSVNFGVKALDLGETPSDASIIDSESLRSTPNDSDPGTPLLPNSRRVRRPLPSGGLTPPNAPFARKSKYLEVPIDHRRRDSGQSRERTMRLNGRGPAEVLENPETESVHVPYGFSVPPVASNTPKKSILKNPMDGQSIREQQQRRSIAQSPTSLFYTNTSSTQLSLEDLHNFPPPTPRNSLNLKTSPINVADIANARLAAAHRQSRMSTLVNPLQLSNVVEEIELAERASTGIPTASTLASASTNGTSLTFPIILTTPPESIERVAGMNALASDAGKGGGLAPERENDDV